MGVRLETDEMWTFLELGHTAIFTSLRRDGSPVSLPVWYIVMEERLFAVTPRRSKKVARVRHDERGCILVEAGKAWRELRAVMLPVRAEVVDNAELVRQVAGRFESKYHEFRTERSAMGDRTRKHYGHGEAVLQFSPTGRPVTWDNRKLHISASSAS